jgi:hypothetical protein
MKNYRQQTSKATLLAAAVVLIYLTACSDSKITTAPAKSDSTPPSAMAGASEDGTAAPSVPSATESLATAPAATPAKAASGGTDDMKKPLSKAAEDSQMPMVGHGNNHSSPDKNAVDAQKPK